MNITEHLAELKKQKELFESFYNNELPTIVGVEAVNFFTESFENEGFTDEVLEPWQEVKRRQDPKRPDRAAASRKILTGDTADLGRSIEYTPEAGQVKITSDTVNAGSDKDYAAAHNEGTTTAGRNRNVTIPKRQFIGKSKKLDEIIDEKVVKRIKRILK